MQRLMNQKVAVAIVFVAAMFMSIMDITIVNVALPTIGADFHVAATSVSSISIAFLVSLAVFIPASGWLGDRFGGKRILLLAVGLFAIASMLCGVAQSMTELVIFRVLQGVGGGLMAPVGMAMLYRVFPPAERVRASSILSFPTALAPAIGPVLGGLLVGSLSWRWVFLVNVPIGVAVIIFGALYLEPVAEKNPGRFDLPGFVMAGVGLGLFMYGVSEGPSMSWTSSTVLATMFVGALIVVGLVLYELRTDEPLVDFRLLTKNLFRIGSNVLLLFSAAILGVLYMITLYYQDGRGFSALRAGVGTFPEAVGVIIGTQIASRILYPRIGPRRLITAGLVCMSGFVAVMGTLGPTGGIWFSQLLMLGMGISAGNAIIPMQAASFATIPPQSMGRASTLFNTSRQLGGAIGVAVFTTILVAVGAVHVVGGHTQPNFEAYHAAFFGAAAFAFIAAVLGSRINDMDAISTMPRKQKMLADQKEAAERAQSQHIPVLIEG